MSAACDRRRGQPGLVPGSRGRPRCVDRRSSRPCHRCRRRWTRSSTASAARPSPRSPDAPAGCCASPIHPANAWRCATARPRPTSPRPPPSWPATNASSSSPWPAAPGAAITPISVAAIHARRIHYLLEPGWRADQAIQGLGRTHRTHQASAPLFRPVTTDVKGERRFIATIARRLDSLGAITRGQRDSQTAMGGGDATPVPGQRQSGEPLRQGGAAPVLHRVVARQHCGLVPWTVSRTPPG